METWTPGEAAEKFDFLFNAARMGRPQRVTTGGNDSVVIISEAAYLRLAGVTPLLEFMQSSPLAEAIAAGEIDLDEIIAENRKDEGRDIHFE